MTLVADAIDLGRLRGHDGTSGPQHRLLYLPERGMIAMPCTRMSGGWHAVIVAARTPRREHHLFLTDDEVAAAPRTIPAQTHSDPDGYAHLVWYSQVFRRWPGGSMLHLARHIVDDLRLPVSVHVPAKALEEHRQIADRLSLTRPATVGRLVDRLIATELLTRATPTLWRLTLPTTTARR